jgi:hypothetical protein
MSVVTQPFLRSQALFFNGFHVCVTVIFSDSTKIRFSELWNIVEILKKYSKASGFLSFSALLIDGKWLFLG